MREAEVSGITPRLLASAIETGVAIERDEKTSGLLKD